MICDVCEKDNFCEYVDGARICSACVDKNVVPKVGANDPVRATFLTIERPLDPQPPKDVARRYSWCYVNTLIFYDAWGRNVWEQKIPEADLCWREDLRLNDWRFDKYFSCEVFFEERFGWQLRIKLSHEDAKFWHRFILEWVKRGHDNYHTMRRNEHDRVESKI